MFVKYVRVNAKIFADKVRLIGLDGEQLGIFPRDLALRKAVEAESDLVEIAPQANPPVCRIMDFSKFKYEQIKREKEVKKHQKQSQLKEIRIRPRIEAHDYEVKLRHVKEFLEKKHKVRIRMMFKGREIAHKDIGKKVIEKLVQDIDKVGKVEKEPQMLGKTMIMILGPK